MTPTLLHTLRDAHAYVRRARVTGARIGLVPTMGALHEGHLSLIRLARAACDCVIVTIFVNPLQFGPAEDLAKYPRQLERDCGLSAGAGADAVFAPTPEAMYSDGDQTRVRVSELTKPLCGASRPGHFEGVTTVVSKLFAIFAPDVAVFGEKDFQQLCVIRRMVRDLGWPIEIVGGPIVREADGLALSSRNAYLGADERRRASAISRALRAARAAVDGGESDPRELERLLLQRLEEAELRVDYAEVVDPETLQRPERVEGGTRACVAVYCGSTRLIDNIALR